MAAIPFGVYMGAATIFGITDSKSSSLLIMLYFSVIVISYTIGLGSLTIIQNNSCGKITNMKQIAGNAGFASLIITLILCLSTFIPFLRNIVVNLFPPSIDPLIGQALGYAYYLFWGAVYGFVVTGHLVSNCSA